MTRRRARPVEPVTAAPEPAPADEAPSLVLPDDTHDEGHEDPIAKISELEARLDQMQALVANRQPRVIVGGYIDLGFFATQGNGSGIIRDQGNLLLPAICRQVRLGVPGRHPGHPPSTRAARPADLGDATGAAPRFDTIHSGGAPSFIANEINMTMTAGLTPSAVATASVNFTPRSGSNFSLGDVFDADIAQLEWMPTRSQKTSIFVGKFDSVLGIEYRDRKSNQRYGITPSLIARYTTGTAVGRQGRAPSSAPTICWCVAGAVTNGSFTQEQFHFYDEIDTNLGKTASGRALAAPAVSRSTWSSASRARTAPRIARPTTSARCGSGGVDYQLHLRAPTSRRSTCKGAAPGDATNDVYGLQLHGGGYVELDGYLASHFGVLGRVEYRDAFVWLGDPNAPGGADRAYLTKGWRATGGVHINFTDRIILKARVPPQRGIRRHSPDQGRRLHVVIGVD